MSVSVWCVAEWICSWKGHVFVNDSYSAVKSIVEAENSCVVYNFRKEGAAQIGWAVLCYFRRCAKLLLSVNDRRGQPYTAALNWVVTVRARTNNKQEQEIAIERRKTYSNEPLLMALSLLFLQ